MPNLLKMISNFIYPKMAAAQARPQSPYALAQTRITRTPQIIAEGGFGNKNISGMFIPSNPQSAVKNYRPDVPEDVFPSEDGLIISPTINDPDYNREVVSHESMHALLNKLGVRPLFNKRKDISERVNPNISPSIKAHIKKTQPLGFSPQGVITNEGLAYAIEDPTANHNALMSLADVLFENKDLTNLETFGKLVSHSILGVKDKERRRRLKDAEPK